MLSYFRKLFDAEPLAPLSLAALKADMHSHILPGLDDGSDNLEDSLQLLKGMISLGYKKLIMTPHIMGDFYKNTPYGIWEKLLELRTAATDAGLDIELGCAAEYYLDEWFVKKLEEDQPLLTFGDNYVLFETSYLNEPLNLKEVVFMMQAAGYKPVLAHPERYHYLHNRFHEISRIQDLGVLLQMNLNSLTGYYSDAARKAAQKLVDQKMISFVGSDLHSLRQIDSLRKAQTLPYLYKVMELSLLNNQL
jgi:protein-tyrosine phosphatase